jgi:DNA ligase (NAD+)
MNELKSNPHAILPRLSIKEIESVLKEADQAYEQGNPIFSDNIYDIIRAYYVKLVPDYEPLAAAATKKAKVKLPIWMGSLDKMPFDKFSFKSNVIISDKLDGISCLLHHKDGVTKLYSRGNGEYGQDISHMMPTPPKFDNQEHIIRGELVISKKNWLLIKDKRSNPRNTVAGLANAKKSDPALLKLVDFIAYEVIKPVPTKPSVGLLNCGLKTVHHQVIKTLTHDMLSNFLLERREQSEYEIDGIVVRHDQNYDVPVGENPKYAFAFKSLLTAEQAEVVVLDVEWNVSKNGLLKPVVIFDQVYISGVHIHRASGHNAKYIKTHEIGPGARLIVIRSGDVIPYILKVLTPASSPKYPDVIQYPWKWLNETEIVLIEPQLAKDYHLRQLENYATVLGIKGLGPKIIGKLYDNAGIDSVKKMVNCTKMDLYRATLSSQLTMKIYKQMQDIYNKGTCVEFMAASNIFAGGFGKKKFNLIVSKFPRILEREYPAFNELLETKGIGERFARVFLDHIQEFHQFMEQVGLACRSSNKIVIPIAAGKMALNNKIIVFTGFRSKALEVFIEERGGRVNSSVSQNTHILVAKIPDDTSIKLEKAKEFNISIMSYKEFVEEVGFVPQVGLPFENEPDEELENLIKELGSAGAAAAAAAEESAAAAATKELLTTKGECIRHVTNWANMKRTHIFGKSSFDVATINLEKYSPKLLALITNIKNLSGKHVIFSDVTKRGFGAKIIASALTQAGFTHVYDQNFKLADSAGNNFAILASTQVYTRPISVDFKKKLLAAYNDRKKNTNGEQIKIIVLDSGYKEGIDLFDVKYVHLYEPLLTHADEMQAIGRATRFCGQSGLPFKKGWTLKVYKYDHIIEPGVTSRDVITRELNIDTSMFALGQQVEKICIDAAIDKLLTQKLSKTGSLLQKKVFEKYAAWPKLKLENGCTFMPAKIKYSPTQEFIMNYFTPANSVVKGMFLWHSLGSGKTCTAVACAGSSWEAEGYSILWVTRGTLRSDVYKNMFDSSCIERIRKLTSLPSTMAARKRLLSKSWLPPISYKQFNNCLLRQNKLYDFLIKRNSYSDPFKKTLLIIDEAHLMLSPTIKDKEKPDMNLLEAWIQNSYKTSGENSVRVLLMSATPVTDNVYNFMRLLNLLDEKPIFKNSFVKNHEFSAQGKQVFMKALDGKLSYLNRTTDKRQFAQPVFQNVHVEISKPTDLSSYNDKIDAMEKDIDVHKGVKITQVRKDLMEKCKNLQGEAKKECKEKVEVEAQERVAVAKNAIGTLKESLKSIKDQVKIIKKNDDNIATALSKKCDYRLGSSSV